MEISESKISDLSEYLEKALRYAGKAMQCIDELKGEERMGERYEEEEMGHRGGDRGYGERRGVRGTGRYSRYY